MAQDQDASREQVSCEQVKVYRVWDRPTRLFHWINVSCVMALIFIGAIMLFKGELGISGLEAKVKLKELHVVVGYLFAVNLVVRLVWGCIGSNSARLSKMLPNFSAVLAYKAKLKQGASPQYLHHNPVGNLAVFAMMVLLVTIMFTGLIRAGTDIYYPPLGGLVSDYIAANGVDGASLKPYDETGVDNQKVAQIKPFKSLAGEVHVYSVYLLILIILVHIAGVIVAEIKHQPGLVSAMISGKKRLNRPPED
ncbi:cytochrome b/b6 domain-containing protein [Shewanella psychrotolerans]|uniref:cytochrome b/b6 domain-containing protein n=1 Tax=Shewanella psychrotolerans TaxID=2864206 RepID=UPI001C658903|nr:cytochrome b/b6 domain-containing protein [Shewanella psychrotolerans]QYK02486.1 cytochrome b/b6 domain-containing protein [Shewanella psychrotolerans]